MSKIKKTFEHVMGGERDANIRFDDLRNLLWKLGFRSRQQGSHQVFDFGPATLNIQEENGKAKKYQVRQARETIREFNLHL